MQLRSSLEKIDMLFYSKKNSLVNTKFLKTCKKHKNFLRCAISIYGVIIDIFGVWAEFVSSLLRPQSALCGFYTKFYTKRKE